MRSTVVAAIIMVGLAVVARPTRAATWLYHPQPGQPTIGQTVPGLPGLWKISDQQRLTLPVAIRRQAVANRTYHRMFAPNDPDFSSQWNLSAINLPAAWDADTVDPVHGGDSRVIVAVLDTGLATAAPDFVDLHLWANSGEIAGDGIDNDQDGYVDDVHGWDFVHNDNSPADDNGHGTHVTATIAESTNNALAAAGIAFNTTIMPLKVLDAAGDGSTTGIAAAINFAVAHGAVIINLSLGGTDDDPILHQTIQSAVSQGVVVTAASGNSGSSTLNYPAVFDEVVSVGATKVDITRASYSSFGTGLDLVAPGDMIIQQTCASAACTTFSSQAYSGTSQATAHVSGVAALLAACGLPTANIAATLESTATDLGSAGLDSQYGNGLINASAALSAAGCLGTAPAAASNLTVVSAAGRTKQLLSGTIYPYVQPSFSWSGPSGGVYQITWGKTGQTATTQQISLSFTPTVATDGTYTFSLTSINALGLTSAPITFTYRYRRAALVVAGVGQVRLYDNQFKSIRRWSGPTATSLSGGQLAAAQTNRLVLNPTTTPATVAVMTTSGQTTKIIVPLGSRSTDQLSSTILERATGSPQLVITSTTRDATLRWYSASGQLKAKQTIYSTYRGGLRLAHGDIDGDGRDELIVGQVSGSEIRVYNDQRQRLSVLKPLGSSYLGGWYVAAGDIDGDGHQEIIAVSAVAGTQRRVWVMTLHGMLVKKWTLSTAPYNGSLDLVASDVIGDGLDHLFIAPRTSGTFIQQWSLTGHKERQVTLSSIKSLRLTALH